MKKAANNTSSWRQILGLGVKLVVVAEVAACLGSYLFWRQMNRDREVRYKVYQMSPYMLNYYYKVGETLGGASQRVGDMEAWGIKDDS